MRRVLAILICMAACHSEAAPTATPSKPALPTGTIRFETPRGPWVVKVEIVADDASRQRGLMFRRDLPVNTGMLFVFQASAEQSFWMHNTYLSLDLIFLGDDRAVVGVYPNAPPQSDDPRGIGKPSRYVVEVSAGEALAHGVGPGTKVAFIGVAE
ncbi:MAG TPA: DUF192 domain-containing protein [Myxococcales bacterium]|jgi:hypothetical protein|nr:DUF192 domain-containing protein [Myxococcales bacterium]